MINLRENDIFNCLPNEMIPSKELVVGDIAKIHNTWQFVTKIEHKPGTNNGNDLIIDNYMGGRAWINPEHLVPRITNVFEEYKNKMLDKYKEYHKELNKHRLEELRDEKERIERIAGDCTHELAAIDADIKRLEENEDIKNL